MEFRLRSKTQGQVSTLVTTGPKQRTPPRNANQPNHDADDGDDGGDDDAAADDDDDDDCQVAKLKYFEKFAIVTT